MSTDICGGGLADDLRFYTLYQASLSQDTIACLQISSTPDRVQRNTRSRWSAVRDENLPTTSTPRSLGMPSTPFAFANKQMIFSPSPLPVLQPPSLVFPEISPPSQGSGSTPFEQQFIGNFSREWNSGDTLISPVLRYLHSPFSLSPMVLGSGGTPFSSDHGLTPQDSPDAVGRISLIDKFMSAAADESDVADNPIRFSTVSAQDRSSPLSDLSDLTSLSSFDDLECGLDPSPPTSPTLGKPKRSKGLSVQCSDRPGTSGREPSPSSSTLSPCSCDSDYRPAKGIKGKRKRSSRSRDGDKILGGRKKRRLLEASEPPSSKSGSSPGALARRNLPADVTYHSQFALLYLRFPVSPYLRLADGKYPLLSGNSKPPAETYNEPRDALDLYTPRFVRGRGVTKVGLCPICFEGPSRGGKGEAVWLSTKFSAYKWHVSDNRFTSLTGNASSYHLQYAHGISSLSGRPFSPPVTFRTTTRQNVAKGERPKIQEGKCHKCKKWIAMESIKNMDIKVKELYWWKHAAACHQGTHIDGDDDFFIDDGIYRHAQAL